MSVQLKEQMIVNYISSLDFTNFNKSDLTVSKIKNDLKQILHENPAVDIVYKGETMIIENGGKKERQLIEKVQSIVVAFIDGDYTDGKGNTIPKVHKFTYVVG